MEKRADGLTCLLGEPFDLSAVQTLTGRTGHLLIEKIAPSHRRHPGPLGDQSGCPDQGLAAPGGVPSLEEPQEPFLLVGSDRRRGGRPRQAQGRVHGG
jgi:hypothetical protein